jgi:hypothetical protein
MDALNITNIGQGYSLSPADTDRGSPTKPASVPSITAERRGVNHG